MADRAGERPVEGGLAQALDDMYVLDSFGSFSEDEAIDRALRVVRAAQAAGRLPVEGGPSEAAIEAAREEINRQRALFAPHAPFVLDIRLTLRAAYAIDGVAPAPSEPLTWERLRDLRRKWETLPMKVRLAGTPEHPHRVDAAENFAKWLLPRLGGEEKSNG